MPDPNDSKEWEILRVAPADDGTWSGNDEDPPAPPHPDIPLSHGIKAAASHPPPSLSPSWLPPEAPSQIPAPKSRRSFPAPPRALPREKPFKCGDCGKSFTRNSNRNAHQRTHGPSQTYPKCGNSAPRRLLSKPHSCSTCGMSFPWSSDPIRHNGPLECPGCGKSFHGNSKLQRRKALGMRPYRCSDCGRSFSYSSAFLKHQRNHGQDRAQQHSQGGNCFPGSSGLRRHQRSHLG